MLLTRRCVIAKGIKTGGKNIKKGEVRNPTGRPRVPAYMKTANKLTKVRFQEILHKYCNHNLEDLKMAYINKKTPALDLVVIKVLIEAIRKGDEKKLGFLLDRMIGKVKEEIEVTGTPHDELMSIIRAKQADESES